MLSHAATLPTKPSRYHEATAKRFANEANVPALNTVPGDEPVEILFIDGAKSWRGMAHLFRIVRERMIPEKTLLVCQDYKYWGTYWVPMMMSRMRGYVEPVHNVLGATTVAFRLTRDIPLSLLGSLEDHVSSIPTEEGLSSQRGAQASLTMATARANVSLWRLPGPPGRSDAAGLPSRKRRRHGALARRAAERARDYLWKKRGSS